MDTKYNSERYSAECEFNSHLNPRATFSDITPQQIEDDLQKVDELVADAWAKLTGED